MFSLLVLQCFGKAGHVLKCIFCELINHKHNVCWDRERERETRVTNGVHNAKTKAAKYDVCSLSDIVAAGETHYELSQPTTLLHYHTFIGGL